MLIYLATPYRADTKEQFEKQLKYTKLVAKGLVLAGDDVIVPHLYYPSFLDDEIECERKLGMDSAKRLIKGCDKVVVGVLYGKSSGVLAEIEYANEHNIPIVEVV